MSPGRCSRTALTTIALALTLGASAPAAQHPQAGLGPSPPVGPGTPAPRASLTEIEQEVMCPVCGVPLSIAQSPQAERERVFIRGLIARGMTKEQIKQALVVQFGRSVLALPSSEGFDLAAYLVPLLVLLALIGLLAVMLPRWRRRGRRPIAAAGPPTLPPGDRARLDDELARFDS